MTAAPKTPAPSDTSDLDPQSLAAIRDLLASEPPVKPQPVEERIAAKAAAQQDPAHLQSRRAPQAQPGPHHQVQPEEPPVQPKRHQKREKPAKARPVPKAPSAGIVARLTSKVTGYRPRPKHMIIAAAALLLFFRPWLVLGVVLLLAFLTTAVFLILGYDGFWHRVMGIARWHARRHPSRSAELHRKLDGFAMRFDAFLDRFPEGTVDGLYLPDFGDLSEAEARHDATLDRRFDSLRDAEA